MVELNNQILYSIPEQYVYPMAAATNGGESHSEFNIRNSLLNLLTNSAANSERDFKVRYAELSKAGDNTSTNNIIKIKLAIDGGQGNCNGYFVKCGPFGTYESVEVDGGISNDDKCREITIDLSNYSNYYSPVENNDKSKLWSTISETLINDTNSRTVTYNLSKTTLTLDLYLSINYANKMASGLSYTVLLSDAEYLYVSDEGTKILHCDSASNTHFNIKTQLQSVYENIFEPQGFNDVGIKIATCKVVYDDSNGKYNDTIVKIGKPAFVENENKTCAINLNRLGDQAGLAANLAELLTRLRELNIWGGKFFISDNIFNNGSANIDLGESGAREKFGGDYRLMLSINNSDEQIINAGDTTIEDKPTISCKLSGGISLVSCSPDSLGLTQDSLGKTQEHSIITFSADTISEYTKTANYSGYIPNISNLQIKISALNLDNLYVDYITCKEDVISKNAYVEKLYLKNGDVESEVIAYDGKDTIETNSNFKANKVYGAVWM